MNRHRHFGCIETLSGGLGGVGWFVLLLALLVGCGNDSRPPPAPGFVVRTLAGTPGVYGFADGPGAQARFAFPHSVATDRAGNVYVADAGNNAIRKISPEGMVSTLAASGLLASPEGIAVDAMGNLYVANGGAQSILKASAGSPPMGG